MSLAKPRFRRDLEVRPVVAEGQSYVEVRDHLAGKSFLFYDFEYQVALAFDGLALEKVIPWVKLATGMALQVEQLQEFARRLDELGFLEREPLGTIEPSDPSAAPQRPELALPSEPSLPARTLEPSPGPSPQAPVVAPETVEPEGPSGDDEIPSLDETPGLLPVPSWPETPEPYPAPEATERRGPDAVWATTETPVTDAQPLPADAPAGDRAPTVPESPDAGKALGVGSAPAPAYAPDVTEAPATEGAPGATGATETGSERGVTQAHAEGPAPEVTETASQSPAPAATQAPGLAPAPPTTDVPEPAPAPPTTEAPEPAPAPPTTEAPEPAPAPPTTEAPELATAPAVTEARGDLSTGAATEAAFVPSQLASAPPTSEVDSLSSEPEPPGPPEPDSVVMHPSEVVGETPRPLSLADMMAVLAAGNAQTADDEKQPPSAETREAQGEGPTSDGQPASELRPPAGGEARSPEVSEGAPAPGDAGRGEIASVAEARQPPGGSLAQHAWATETGAAKVPTVDSDRTSWPGADGEKAVHAASDKVDSVVGQAADAETAETESRESSDAALAPSGAVASPPPPAAEPAAARSAMLESGGAKPLDSPAFPVLPVARPAPTEGPAPAAPPAWTTPRPVMTPVPTTFGPSLLADQPSARRRIRRSFIVFGTLGVLAAAALLALTLPFILSSRRAVPVEVRTLAVTPGTVYRYFDGAGTIAAMAGTTLKFPAGGKVTRIAGKGSAVAAGDVVAAVETARALQTQLDRQRERLAYSQQMAEAMHQVGNSKEEERQLANAEAKNARIAKILQELANFAVVATGAGEVEAVFAQEGQTVEAGSPAVRLVSPGFRATFALPRPQASAARRLGFCQVEVEGYVLDCNPAQPTGNEEPVTVELSSVPPALVGKPAHLARARFAGAVVLPVTTLRSDASQDEVFVVTPSAHLEARRVVVAERDEAEAVVVQGLDLGDKVVVLPGPGLRAGMSVGTTGGS
jgi:hypothetical protein